MLLKQFFKIIYKKWYKKTNKIFMYGEDVKWVIKIIHNLK